MLSRYSRIESMTRLHSNSIHHFLMFQSSERFINFISKETIAESGLVIFDPFPSLFTNKIVRNINESKQSVDLNFSAISKMETRMMPQVRSS